MDDLGVRFAEQRAAELGAEIRQRILDGWDIRYCMGRTRRGSQCLYEGPPLRFAVFGGIVGFCDQHSPAAILRRPAELREELRRKCEREQITAANNAARERVQATTGVYVVLNPVMGRAKIGVTSNWPGRKSQLRSGAAGELEVLLWHPEPDGWHLESHLHRSVSDVRVGLTEWFECPDADAFMARVRDAIREWSEEYTEVEV